MILQQRPGLCCKEEGVSHYVDQAFFLESDGSRGARSSRLCAAGMRREPRCRFVGKRGQCFECGCCFGERVCGKLYGVCFG